MNEQLIKFLKGTPNSNKAAITAAIGVKGLPLFNLLKKMLADGQITSLGEGNETTYSLAEPQSEEQPIAEEAPQPVVVSEEVQVTNEQAGQVEQTVTVVDEAANEENKEKGQQDIKATATKSTTSRDNTKYVFEKETYGKGKLVVACLKKIIELNPSTTFAHLKELFPDTLMKRFGVFEEIKKAKEISGTRDRYFFKEEDVIKLADKKVVICSQWTAGLIAEFIKTAKTNGFKIKEA